MRNSDSYRKQWKPRRQKTVFKDQWAYAKHARKPRHCERCYKKLRWDEAHICKGCYQELLGDSTKEDLK